MNHGRLQYRMPYKDNVFNDEPHIGSPSDELLEEVEEMNEDRARGEPR